MLLSGLFLFFGAVIVSLSLPECATAPAAQLGYTTSVGCRNILTQQDWFYTYQTMAEGAEEWVFNY